MNAALVADYSFSAFKTPVVELPFTPSLKLVDSGRDFGAPLVTPLPVAVAATNVAPAPDMRVVFDLPPALSPQNRMAIVAASFLVSVALFSTVALGLTSGAKPIPVTHHVARV